jgi:type I restriction enzyme M protein
LIIWLPLPESADIGEAIDNAMKLIEDEYDNLKGVLPKNFSIFSKDLLRELLRIFNKEVLQKAEGDLFGKIYEYFLGKFAMTGAQEGGEFFTPMSLVQTIVNVIEPDHGIVFDPACGSAGMFVQTGYFIESEGLKPAEKVTFYGQEKAELNTKLAKMNSNRSRAGRQHTGRQYFLRRQTQPCWRCRFCNGKSSV